MPYILLYFVRNGGSLIARFMGPAWGPSGADRWLSVTYRFSSLMWLTWITPMANKFVAAEICTLVDATAVVWNMMGNLCSSRITKPHLLNITNNKLVYHTEKTQWFIPSRLELDCKNTNHPSLQRKIIFVNEAYSFENPSTLTLCYQSHSFLNH